MKNIFYYIFITCVSSGYVFSGSLHMAVNVDKSSRHYGSLELFGIESTILKKLESRRIETEQWRQFFSVYVNNDYSENEPAVLGQYTVDNDALRFKSRFGFIAGINYAASFDIQKLYELVNEPCAINHSKITCTFQMPDEKKISYPRVEKLFPTSDTLPMNLLKAYIYFSEPMRQGQAYNRIRLYNITEKCYEEDAFLAAPVELWDREHKRLTLFFDPGRIKRDLTPNLQLGLPLKEGNRYRLEIDKNWKDIYDNPLVSSFEKIFSAGPADRLSPDEKNWTVMAPASGTEQPLVLTFNEPLDEGLLNRLLMVCDNDGNQVKGYIQIDDHEQRWIYTPLTPWQSGNYSIKIDSRLEDLAGNDIMQLFDVDLNDPLYQKRDEKEVILSFEIPKLF